MFEGGRQLFVYRFLFDPGLSPGRLAAVRMFADNPPNLRRHDEYTPRELAGGR